MSLDVYWPFPFLALSINFFLTAFIWFFMLWYVGICKNSFNILGFPCGSAGKESAYKAGNLGLIPGLGRFPGEWKGYPLQYSGLESSMDCIVHGVTKSQTRLSNFHFTFYILDSVLPFLLYMLQVLYPVQWSTFYLYSDLSTFLPEKLGSSVIQIPGVKVF